MNGRRERRLEMGLGSRNKKTKLCEMSLEGTLGESTSGTQQKQAEWMSVGVHGQRLTQS